MHKYCCIELIDGVRFGNDFSRIDFIYGDSGGIHVHEFTVMWYNVPI